MVGQELATAALALAVTNYYTVKNIQVDVGGNIRRMHRAQLVLCTVMYICCSSAIT